MKQLFFLFAISLPLILIGCSNDEEISPLSTQFEGVTNPSNKTSVSTSDRFKLYQTFPELKVVRVSWYNNAKGLVITVGPLFRSAGQLFAVIEFGDVDPAINAVQMVYLGSSSKGTYLIRGIKNRAVSSVKIYLINDENLQDRPEPYSEYQLFNSIGIKGWNAADDKVKVSSENFPARLNHLFAELKAVEGNELIFLGKPSHEDFDFPKSTRQTLTGINLIGYVNPIVSAYPTLAE